VQVVLVVLMTTAVVNAQVETNTPTAAKVAQFAYQNVKIELFTDDEAQAPCSSADNYTLTFKNMKLDTGDCVTHLFPKPSMEDGEKWMQFSSRAVVRPDSGLNIWLYFTRDEVSGAITYCAEENIQNMPYPLQVSPVQNGVCQVIAIPKFQLDDEEESEPRSMGMRVTYDVARASRLVGALKDSSGFKVSGSIFAALGSTLAVALALVF